MVQRCECVGPDVGAEEVLAVDGGRNIGDDGLYVSFDRVPPLLIWRGALMVALVVLSGAKLCIVVTSQNSGFESAGSKESEYTVEVVEKDVFIACLHRVAEEIFAPSVAKGDELTVPFHALGADGATLS